MMKRLMTEQQVGQVLWYLEWARSHKADPLLTAQLALIYNRGVADIKRDARHTLRAGIPSQIQATVDNVLRDAERNGLLE